VVAVFATCVKLADLWQSFGGPTPAFAAGEPPLPELGVTMSLDLGAPLETAAGAESEAAGTEEPKAAEQRIDQKITELEQLQATIEDLLVQHDEQDEAQMQSLVKIYESMKPKDAARIFEELDMEVLLEVVERMKERKTAPILAQMNPERAKEVTLELAQRRELPLPRE